MKVTIQRDVAKRCPHRDEMDIGLLEIEFYGEAPELHELSNLIDDIAAEPISHEDYTKAVYDLCLGIDARVRTQWQTGEWAVTVTQP